MGTRLDTSYLVNEFNDQIINQLGEPDPLLVDEYELFIESLEIAVDKRNNRDGLALSEFKQGFKLFADASGLFATQGRIQQDDYQQIAFESGVNLYLLGEEVDHLPQSFERENLQDRNIERWNLHIMSSMGNLDGNDISGLSFKTHFSTDPEDIDFTGATLDPYQKISLDGYTDFNDVEVADYEYDFSRPKGWGEHGQRVSIGGCASDYNCWSHEGSVDLTEAALEFCASQIASRKKRLGVSDIEKELLTRTPMLLDSGQLLCPDTSSLSTVD
jgi:hypothetical protein